MKNLIKFILNPIYKRWAYRKINTTDLNSLKNNRIIEPELLLVSDYIRKGDIVFDIGANAGEYTFKFEQCVGSKNVYSFEPIPKLYKNLKRIFRKVNIELLAFSNKSTLSQFKIPVINDVVYDTRGKLDIEITEPGETNYELIEVQCKTIDEYVIQKSIPKIKLIKIDVEGHEFNVLKGATKTLRKLKPIILIEIEQRHHDMPIDVIFNFINELGYEIKFYSVSDFKYYGIEDFNVLKYQNYENIKTMNYINNFWCFPSNRKQYGN